MTAYNYYMYFHKIMHMMLNERENSQQYTDQSYNVVVAVLKR